MPQIIIPYSKKVRRHNRKAQNLKPLVKWPDFCHTHESYQKKLVNIGYIQRSISIFSSQAPSTAESQKGFATNGINSSHPNYLEIGVISSKG